MCAAFALVMVVKRFYLDKLLMNSVVWLNRIYYTHIFIALNALITFRIQEVRLVKLPIFPTVGSVKVSFFYFFFFFFLL